ncbi:MAG: hypothetical protein M0R80_07795 [Proteobacteria bacterium]|jgi:hypothetical protein|nr:hypothetical protein [Pseudomonadota bacterium]
MSNKIALFDMDQTLFDYEGQLRRDLALLKSPGELDPLTLGNLWDADEPWMKARMDLIKMRPGWWRDLPRLQVNWVVLAMCRKIGFTIQILTKGPDHKPHVWTEKVECVRLWSELSDCMIHITGDDECGHGKGQVYGRVLVDDYPKYIHAWLKHRKRGLVIMPVNNYNCSFSHPNLVPFDGKNIEEVQRVLQAAYARKDKQHWKDLI